MDGVVRAIAWAVGVFMLVTGVWAFFAPASFYETIATFPPYNEHFLHDIGAFQIGLGAALLLALRIRDSLLVVLAGVGAGSAVHVLAHAMDGHLGGRATDVPGLAILLAAVLYALARRARATEPSDETQAVR